MLRTLYSLTAGTYTAIPALRFSRLVKLEEDGTGTGVGLICKFPEDNYTATFTYPPAQQPIILGDEVAIQNGRGKMVGIPVQTGLNTEAATVYAMVSCLTGTTVLRVTEED
ncbi:MAG TPA: hypothetical protein VGU67_02965 [Edaphobacter sp.]|nr:hypothetical protein [Edaphobacter sp.]